MAVIDKSIGGDLCDVLALLEEVGLPIEGVAKHFQNFFVSREDDRLVGCAGIEQYGDVGLLRSVAVHPSFQGRGLGQKLVDRMHLFACKKDIKKLYLITETAVKFFLKQNYMVVPRGDVDARIRQTIEFTQLCASSGVCMVRYLTPNTKSL